MVLLSEVDLGVEASDQAVEVVVVVGIQCLVLIDVCVLRSNYLLVFNVICRKNVFFFSV